MKRSLDLKKFYLNNVKLLTILFLIFILLTVSDKSFAAGIFDSIIGTFDTSLTGIGALLQKYAINLFLILAAIAIVWTGCELIMTKGDLSDFFAQFLKLIIILGFFYYLVSGGGLALCRAFLESMSQLGGSSMGDSGASASSMVDKLIGLEGAINYDWESDLGALKSLAIFSVYLLIVIAGFVIIINLVLLWITALLCIYSGVIVLGFGSLGWTREIAISYFRQVANVCLQLLVVMIIFSIASNEMNSMIDSNPKTTTVEKKELGAPNSSMVRIDKIVVKGGLAMPHLIKLFAMTFLLAVCSYKVPPLIGNMVGGAGSGNMSIGIGHAIAVTAASAAAAASVVTGGVSLASSTVGAASKASKSATDAADKMTQTATNKDPTMGLNGISGGDSEDSSQSGSAFSDNKSDGGQLGGGQSDGGQSGGEQSDGGQSGGGQSDGGQSGGEQSDGGQLGGGQSGGGQSGGEHSGGEHSGGSSEASSDNDSSSDDSSSDDSSGSNDEQSGKNLAKDTGKFIANTAKTAAIYGKDMLEIAASDNPAGASSIASHYSSGSGGSGGSGSGGSGTDTDSSVPDYKKGISNSNPNADTNINPNINPHRTGRDDYKKG